MKLPFRFRSLQRDTQTDWARVDTIFRAISNAIGSAQKEREALEIRVNQARDLAALAAGNESDEYLTRDRKDHLAITEFENQLAAGEGRIRELDDQIVKLLSLQDLANQRFPEFVNKPVSVSL